MAKFGLHGDDLVVHRIKVRCCGFESLQLREIATKMEFYFVLFRASIKANWPWVQSPAWKE